MKKLCKKCNIEKSLNNFHIDKTSKDNLYRWCNQCKKEYDKNYRKSDKIKQLYSSKEYRDSKKEYRIYRSNTSVANKLFTQAKSRAKKQNLPFNIEIEDIIVPDKCPLLNIDLYQKPYGSGTGFHFNSPSLDKIIPELGYVKGNIMVISMKANAMKYCATIEELKTFSNNILKIFKT